MTIVNAVPSNFDVVALLSHAGCKSTIRAQDAIKFLEWNPRALESGYFDLKPGIRRPRRTGESLIITPVESFLQF